MILWVIPQEMFSLTLPILPSNSDGNAGKISQCDFEYSYYNSGKFDYQFKIYGVKKIADNKYSKVFGDYSIWYNTNRTTSNTNDWEYVANAGDITTGVTEKSYKDYFTK